VIRLLLASITRNDLKGFSLSLRADKSASYKNRIPNAGGWRNGLKRNLDCPARNGPEYAKYNRFGGGKIILKIRGQTSLTYLNVDDLKASGK
jgi:hypothetical protein